MTTTPAYIIQGNNIVIMTNNKCYNVTTSHFCYGRIFEAIKNGDWETVDSIIEPKKVMINYGSGNVGIKGDIVYWKDREMHSSLSNRMVKMYQEGFSIEPMVKFMDNLMENPSKTAVEELYTFLEYNTLPITPDGYFLAYKKVTEDYKDCHTKSIDNSVGQTVSVDRNFVDDNRYNTCSTGLHFCSLEYLDHFGGSKIMILKINPRDVVSIPVDYNYSKGRCCEYTVIGELGVSPEEAFTKPVQESSN